MLNLPSPFRQAQCLEGEASVIYFLKVLKEIKNYRANSNSENKNNPEMYLFLGGS